MNKIVFGDNIQYLKTLVDESVNLIYIDPPFNTGKIQKRESIKTVRSEEGDRIGFAGKSYKTEVVGEKAYNDSFDDFLSFLEPRLRESHRILAANGSFFLHLDYREVHYAKILMDDIFGRDNFINEIIWSYDYGARSRSRWSCKHDNILWYAKDKDNYVFNYDAIDRIPYMAPDLVGEEKAAKGKTPTDCYDDKTDILTNRGWIKFSDLTDIDLVASISDKSELEFFKPTHIIKKLYNGPMVEIKSKTINCCVTPGHNMYVKRKHAKHFEFISADALKNQHYSCMNRVDWNGKIPTDKFIVPDLKNQKKYYKKLPSFDYKDWCRFMGWYLSEGSTSDYKSKYLINITQTKKQNLTTISNMLDRMGIIYRYDGHSFNIYNKQLWTYLKQFGKAQNKFIPRELMDLSKEYLSILCAALEGGDGHIRMRKNWTEEHSYITTSIQLSSDIQELYIKLGYNSNTGIHFKGDEKWNKCYRVSRRVSKESTIWPKRHIKQVQYSGFVYCCTVEPHHTILVRREGKSMICGNCWWNTIVPTNGKEKTDYPTQKPLNILNRIVTVHSNEGDVVMDFFAGSGTTGEAAAMNNRTFVLVDSNPQSIDVMKKRLSRFNFYEINI